MFVKILALINKITGQIAQSIVYGIVIIATVLINNNIPLFDLIGSIILLILLSLIIVTIVITVILILSHKLDDDASYDRNKTPTEFWTVFYRVSAVLVPFYIWFTFIRYGTVENTTLYILIWILQWAILFNSFFYNAFLKQHIKKQQETE